MNTNVVQRPAHSRFTTDDDDTLKYPMTLGTLFVYVLISAVLLNQLLLYFHYPSISSFLLIRWRRFVKMVSSRITYLLERYYGSINGAINGTMSPRQDIEASRSGMSRVMGLNKLPGFHAAGYFSGSHGRATSKDIRRSMEVSGDDGPPGLGNWDNSCYQNSVLQGIASLRSIPKYLDSLMSSLTNHLHSSGIYIPTVMALREFVDDLNSPRNSGRLLWTPSVLKSMSSWQQQDAQEYFSKILDQLDKEYVRAIEQLGKRNDSGLRPKMIDAAPSEEVNRRYEEFDLQQGSGRLLHAKADLYSGLLGSSSVKLWQLQNPLEGFLAQRVGCLQCGWSEGLSMIPFICLTLPLDRGWSFDLESCLDEYTKLEHIEGVECARCTLLRARSRLEFMMETSDSPEQSRTPTRDELLQSTVLPRLHAINSALDEEDFSENTLLNKCKINPRDRVTVTKSRQAVIARAPKSLVIHINRSVFDELSGMQTKNYAGVNFPKTLDLGPWCLDFKRSEDGHGQTRILEPAESLLADEQTYQSQESPLYQIRAVVTHYGRHENGHYICYRQYPTEPSHQEDVSTDQGWWRLSDDEVTSVTEEDVLKQEEVFMLFYDRVDSIPREEILSMEPEIVSQNKTAGLEGHTGIRVEPADSNETPPESYQFSEEGPALASAHLDQFNKQIYQEIRPGTVEGSETTSNDTESEESEETERPCPANSVPAVPKASYSGVEIQKRSHMAASSMSSLVMAN